MIIFIALLNIISTISVIFIERKKPHEALLWVLILNAFPLGGMLLYLAFGSTLWIKITYKIRSGKADEHFRSVMEEVVKQPQMEDIYKLLSESQKKCLSFNQQYSHSYPSPRNRIEILTSGKEKYERLFEDLSNAQHSINIVYYGIHNDWVGKRLMEILSERACAGVDVRLLYDGMGSFLTPSRFFKKLRKAGGKVKAIKSLFTHFRNHRKIVVIDGLIGYTGGMNIGKKYVGEKKDKTPWRDTQIRIEGDGVYFLQYFFVYDWLFAYPRKKFTDEQIIQLFPQHDINELMVGQVIGSGVDRDEYAIKMAYLRMVSAAQKRIVIQTPYYIPNTSLQNAITIAASSGIEVIIMLPQRKSSFFLQPTTRYYISELLSYGVKVWLYDGYLHAKTITIDDEITCIGSVNIDIRSMEVDDEICMCVYDAAFAQRHMHTIEDDLAHSAPLDVEAFNKRPLWQRFAERIFALFAPLM
ncbi:cardiolipin synthase [Eubacteriales bacterium OttesenSCG-928-N14]|nr:cardiolipin synthase [Eubacteriales bacterium OttesenSCG-928-N14]